ncbi:hypothetical protein Glove_429g25 [Diversispora epigaea]|uniref:Uncharacterized protein n=1 Tax=Diversispora epigaea TaxID=1348612 RepID=A0A397GT22_9GLOM|nr:hypothetical protein Glove_429g25 [Diversispora epigaea]
MTNNLKNDEIDLVAANSNNVPPIRHSVSFPLPGSGGVFQSFGSVSNQIDEQGSLDHNKNANETVLEPIVEENLAIGESSSQPRRGQKIPTRIHVIPQNSSNSRRLSRSRSYFPGSYSASFSNERVPWNSLRQYNDSLLSCSPQSLMDDNIHEDPSSMMSPTDGLFSVIMDDGTLQNRRISLTSEYSRQNTENTPLLEDYDNYDSDSDIEILINKNPRYENSLSSYYYNIKHWLQKKLFTPNQKNIIKCALSFFLASLFTYTPFLFETFDLYDLQISHLVASVVVFFNPAKTIGGIYEAVFFSFLGGIYGMLVGIGSMVTAKWFYSHDMPNLGHLITVVVWCGGSMFIVAFNKAKFNKPAFNSACSLANIIIFVTLTREGALILDDQQKKRLIQVTKIILIGIVISFLVSILIWPTSASKKLRNDIDVTLKSFRILLKLLTKTFLIDDIHYTDESVQSAIASYRATFTSLQDSLKQAAFEVHNQNMQQQLSLYKEVVKSLIRLAQHLGGLRSCCGLQWEIIKDQEEKKEPNTENQRRTNNNNDSSDEEESGNLRVLIEFIRFVGPPMKSLAFTCKQTILHLQDLFASSNNSLKTTSSFTVLHQNLQSALTLFEESQSRGLNRLYKKNNNLKDRPNEEIFLIYFFVFNLQEFTRELTDLVDLVDMISRIDAKEQERRERRRWWQFWLFFSCFARENSFESARKESFIKKMKDKFPENTHNLFDTLQTPKPKTFWQKITMKIWKSLSWFRQFEVKYAFKAAVSAAILVSPAFIESTRDLYYYYRGEWACITMMVVMVPTVGGTNLVAIYRVLGTLFGSYLSWVIYTLFPDNPVILSIFGFIIALGCFKLILYTKYNRIGTFILLTYNLVALYRYNIRDKEPVMDIKDIAWTRFIAVSTGVIWGVVVTNYLWPYEARAELRKGLSQLFVNMGWLYKKLVAVYSTKTEVRENPQTRDMESYDTTVLLPKTSQHLSKSTKEFMDMELFLQVSLLKLSDLLAQTPNEPRLKGPFPRGTYNEILSGCQNILDKLLSMRIAVTKEDRYASVRRDFILPISRERKELVGNVLLYFYILAAALKLKTPLPIYLPPAEKARRRLVKKIRDLPVVKQRVIEGNDAHYIVYYAYALVMEDVIKELEHLGKCMQDLFGCMGGDEFNTFFTDPDESGFNDHHTIAQEQQE